MGNSDGAMGAMLNIGCGMLGTLASNTTVGLIANTAINTAINTLIKPKNDKNSGYPNSDYPR
jgi:hypothetical protein